MKSRYQMAVLAIVLGGFAATAPAQVIFDENFDGGYTGAFGTGSYSGGSPTATGNAVLASGGNPNGCWQETMTTTTGSDYYTGQVQLTTVSGNTDSEPVGLRVVVRCQRQPGGQHPVYYPNLAEQLFWPLGFAAGHKCDGQRPVDVPPIPGRLSA